MFEPFVIEPQYVEKNARVIAEAILGDIDGDVRTLLHTALNQIQPDTYSWTPGALIPDTQFDSYDGLREPVLQRIMVVDKLPAGWKIESRIRQQFRRNVVDALGTLCALDPAIHRSVTTLIAALLFGRLEHLGGGSNSSAIGCVWLNPKPSWTEVEWLENLFHEYVHQALFIDDMSHGLFTVDGEVLARENALSRSAILKTYRPYDRVYHSAFVSFSLMQLNAHLGRRERIVEHIQPLAVTIEQLFDKSTYLTPHGFRVLESLSTAFADFQADRAALC